MAKITNTTDQNALLALKSQITLDPHNILAQNWSTATSYCSWIGVTCGSRHKRVTTLNLSNMGLIGSIPPHLGNLSFLASFDVQNNSFHGQFPDELSSLRRLKVIHLEYNNFAGTIPTSLCNISNLQTLSFSSNQLHGYIPKEIGNLTKLNYLSLASNYLSGSIPHTIFNMSSLQFLRLDYNNLTGSLPEDLCDHFPKLEMLYLRFNLFYGQIPPNIHRCRHLQFLAFSLNKFAGSIPREIGNLNMLKELYIGGNSLQGRIPREIGNLTKLTVLSLGQNNLEGSIPREIGNLTKLTLLTLRANNLEGCIPREIGNLTMLTDLGLQTNNLKGAIPHEIGNIRNLEKLGLTMNNLTGLIPFEIFNMSKMKLLALSRNHLSGQLPSTFGLWLPNLEGLYLWGNKLSGVIPNSISNASKLIILALADNSLTGFIPNTLGNLRLLEKINLDNNFLTRETSTVELKFLTSLANCKYLRRLQFSSNPLNGILPVSIGNLSASLQYFFASYCQIKGSIPREFGNLRSLIKLDLTNNELTGYIPTQVKRLKKLQGLYLQGNRLQGSIPHDICHLKSLVDLHSHENNLSGLIPACMGDLTSLRSLHLGSNKLTSIIPSTLWSLTDILKINLSVNSLSGYLPVDIGNLKVVTTIDLSSNQLVGEIPSTIGGLQSLANLSLVNNEFQGPIPQSFGELISLEFLDLSNNNLSGVIPKSLEELLYLKYLNVSVNKLEGEIPTKGPFAKFSAQSFLLNDALCGAPRLEVPLCKTGSLRHSRTMVALLLKYVLPAIAVTFLVVALIIGWIKHQKRNVRFPIEANLSYLAWRRISYQELFHATNGFCESNLLGIGGFGSVYRGILSDGIDVAIKVFNLQLEATAFKSFDAECEALRNIRHRNLVKIISSCTNIDFKALVFEYMPNGSLEKWLYSHNYSLDILQRLNIMIDVASALEYLHHGYSAPIVHCDLKPSNVLLDEDMVAHLGDFGIAKLLGEEESMTRTNTLATIGYMAPEYGSEGVVSTRGDVYSYGILLMETFTRKKPIDEMFAREMSLKSWVKESLPHVVIEVVDTNLLRREEEHFTLKKDCISSILELALDCSVEFPKERIDIKDVLATLNTIRTKFPMSSVGIQNM